MENSIYPKIKNAILLCLLFLGIQIGFGIIFAIYQLILDISDASPVMGVIYIISDLIIFGIVLFIGFKKTKLNFNEVFKLNRVSPFLWGVATIMTIGLAIVMSEINNAILFILPMPEWLSELFSTLLQDQPLFISLIYIGLIAALCEELLFRGLILDGFVKNYSKKKAIIISALLFGLVHLNPWQFVVGFIVGLVLAWICIETKSILLCIYIHFLNNAGAVIMFRLNDVIPIKGFNIAEPVSFQPIWFTLSGLVLLSVGILLFYNSTKKLKTEAQYCDLEKNDS